MNNSEVEFAIRENLSSNYIARYYVIKEHMGRVLFVLIYIIWIASLFQTFIFGGNTLENSFMTTRQKIEHELLPYAQLVLFLGLPIIVLGAFSEWMYTEKMFKRRVRLCIPKYEKQLLLAMGKTSRSIYRYCASLEMSGDKLVITDKVKDLIGGDLIIPNSWKTKDKDIIKFKFSINQITAMWISRDLIVLRFCWGMDVGCEWDVILDRSKFTKGSDRDFVRYMTKNLIFKKITYDLEKFANSNGRLHLGNDQTNVYRSLIFPWVHQRRVKIYHNFWGPFKKRKKQEKDEKQASEEEAK